MKKIILSISFLCAFCICKAQFDQVKLGIESGPNIANVHSDPISNVGGDVYNYSIGLVCEYNINDRFSIRSGLIYEKKGYTESYGYVATVNNYPMPYSVDEPNSLNYIVLPVMAKAKFGYRKIFFVEGGIYFGYLVSASSTYPETDSSGAFTKYKTTNTINNYNSIDVGVCFGAGVGIPINTKFVIELEGRTCLGLTNINNNVINLSAGFNPPVLLNQSANVLLGIRYRL